MIAAIAISVAAFASAIPGGFVGDDDVQIVRNAYIQDTKLLGRALGADVWGFVRAGGEPVSGYWRPLFVAWLVTNYRLFGLAPSAWHLTSLVLHVIAILLAAVVLRRLGIRLTVTAAVLWVFAAHPVHVEAVAWASGAPDLLLSIFVLASFALHLSQRRAPSLAGRIAAAAAFAAALLSKETAIAYPAFLLACEWALAGDERPALRRLASAGRCAAPYFVVAAVVVTARVAVLGSFLGPGGDRMGFTAWLLVLPRALAFYLRQALWPATLGPLYPLHAEASSVALSLLAAVAVSAGAVWLWRRGVAQRVGVAMFFAFLAPVLLGLRQFEPERLVQDRYLYLPLLGLALAVCQTAGDAAGAWLGAARADRALGAVGFALALVLAIESARYNRVFRDDVALWERAVELNPNSVYALGALGFHCRVAGRAGEAQAVLTRAERLDPEAPQVLLELGLVAADEERYEQAERLLGRAFAAAPDDETIADHLGRVLVALDRYDAAIAVFSDARERHPDSRLKNTINIAVTCRAAGRPERATAELQSIRDDLERQRDPTLLLGLWHLGEAELALGRRRRARAAFEAFLKASAGLAGELVETHRRLAAERLAGLSRRPT